MQTALKWLILEREEKRVVVKRECGAEKKDLGSKGRKDLSSMKGKKGVASVTY